MPGRVKFLLGKAFKTVRKAISKSSSFFLKNEDKIVLYLNRVSNRYGTSWARGLFFTLFVSSLVHFIIFMTTDSIRIDRSFSYDSIVYTAKYIIKFLNITNWDYKPFDLCLTDGMYLFLFIGRIFIAYGISQTIQAFRKFSKN